MQYHPLGQSGLQVSSIGMGCVTFGREIEKELSFQTDRRKACVLKRSGDIGGQTEKARGFKIMRVMQTV